jgi:hypothetical protein
VIEKVHIVESKKVTLAVTLSAVQAKFPFVYILVTGHTALFLQSLKFILKNCPRICVHLMTTKAIYDLVITLENEPGRSMIKPSHSTELVERALCMA